MAKKQPAGSGFQLLKQALKNKDLGRLYMFHGEETFLLHHYLEQMKKQLLDELTESFNYHRLNNETFDLRSFADAVENLPMMAENTFVQVDDVDPFKMNEADRNETIKTVISAPELLTKWRSNTVSGSYGNEQEIQAFYSLLEMTKGGE